MDVRILLAAGLGLALLAVGGFYFALSWRHDRYAPPVAAASHPAAEPVSSAAAPATVATMEAEIARSENAELLGILKTNFASEYDDLIALAVRRRNEGASNQQFNQDIFARLQDIMRPKLKFAAGASTETIDRIAANELGLFHALGTDGASFCLRVLGKDTAPADAQTPAAIREMLRLGALYRFQAIVEGRPNAKSVDALTSDEVAAFQTSLAREGLKFEEVNSGAFLTKEGEGPGKPCLMIERLYQSIVRLPEGARRKIYSGMFFLGREN